MEWDIIPPIINVKSWCVYSVTVPGSLFNIIGVEPIFLSSMALSSISSSSFYFNGKLSTNIACVSQVGSSMYLKTFEFKIRGTCETIRKIDLSFIDKNSNPIPLTLLDGEVWSVVLMIKNE